MQGNIQTVSRPTKKTGRSGKDGTEGRLIPERKIMKIKHFQEVRVRLKSKRKRVRGGRAAAKETMKGQLGVAVPRARPCRVRR